MLRDKRKKELKQRRGYLITLLITGILWSSIALIIFYVDPAKPFIIPIFFVSTFLALLFTLSLLLGNTRRGFLFSIVLTLFLLLSYLKAGTVINFILLFGAALAFEFYFTNKS